MAERNIMHTMKGRILNGLVASAVERIRVKANRLFHRQGIQRE
jgi:hypothetical protein